MIGKIWTFFGLCLIIGMSSCSNKSSNTKLEDLTSVETRSLGKTFYVGNEIIFLKPSDIIEVQNAQRNEDDEVISSVFFNLNSAQSLKKIEGVSMTSSWDDHSGYYMISVKSEADRKFTFSIYDEEGFETVANNRFDVLQGQNYKALNLKDLENGSYIIRISDDTDGSILENKVEIF